MATLVIKFMRRFRSMTELKNLFRWDSLVTLCRHRGAHSGQDCDRNDEDDEG